MSAMAIGRGKLLGTAAAVAMAMSLVPIGNAQAAVSQCKITSYTPNKLVVGASDVKLTIKPKITNCTNPRWGFATDALPDDSAASQEPTITVTPRTMLNMDAGKKEAYFAVTGDEDTTADPRTVRTTFQLLRRSTFGSTLNATPEPVKKGNKITIRATLARVSWDGASNGKYVGFPQAKAKLQFKANGTTAYKNVKWVTAAAGGKFATTVKADRSGRYRLVFAGISTTAPATSTSDAIVVRN